MKQELTQLDQILKGEHWQDNLNGFTWNAKIQQKLREKQLHELQMVRMEHDLAELKSGKQKIREQNICDSSIVAALSSVQNRKIKEIGFNTPDDLILNNFGVFLAYLIQSPNTVNYSYSMVDITNASRLAPYHAWYTGSTFNYGNQYGTQIQFGSGLTAAARANYAIQTALGSAPENTRFSSGSGSYASNYISFGNVIVAGGSGTINEIGFFFYINWTGNTFMICRDVLGAGVSYVAGNPLVGTFTLGI